MDEAEGVGRRVRAVRKLAGWTQDRLAQHAHVSTSLVKAVEQGRVPASPAFVATAAHALGVSVHDLYAESTPRFGQERAGVADLETAVMAGPALACDDEHDDLDRLAARVAEIAELQRHGRYDASSALMSPLIEELHTAAATVGGERAHYLLSRVYGCAVICLHRLGSPLNGQAAERAATAAHASGDPLLAAMADVEVGLPLLHRGAYAAADRIAANAREDIADHPGTVDTLSVRGFTHLRSAIAAARAGDAQTSTAHLDEAAGCAAYVPDGTDLYDTAFNPSNVTMHSVAAAVELGDGTTAIERNRPLSESTMPSRRAHHHVDMARAYLLHGDRDGCLLELNAAREASPQLTRYHPQVAETVRVLAETDRRRTDTLAGFARWAGIRV